MRKEQTIEMAGVKRPSGIPAPKVNGGRAPQTEGLLVSPGSEVRISQLGRELLGEGRAIANYERKRELKVDKILAQIGEEDHLEKLVEILFSIWGQRSDAVSDAQAKGTPQYAATAPYDWVLRYLNQRIIALLDEQKDPTVLTKLLFGIWVQLDNYDVHMKSTGHDHAIDILLRQLIALDREHAQVGMITVKDNRLVLASKPKIVDGKVLEATCGTGTVIKMLHDDLKEEERQGIKITANDLSEDMKERAKQKLDGLFGDGGVGFTDHDVRDLKFEPGTFNLAILAQTLHLITSKEQDESEADLPLAGEKDFTTPKLEAIKRIFEILDTGGHFLMIDEWTPKLSERADNPFEELIQELFKRHFQPLYTRGLFRDRVMRNVPGARFVAELKARIDSDHVMYAMLYSKDPNKLERRCMLLPDSEDGAKEAGLVITPADQLKPGQVNELEDARREAVARLINSFMAIDQHFIEGHRPKNGEALKWIEFTKVDGEGQALNGIPYIVDSLAKIDKLGAEERYETVIVERILHDMTEDQRLDMMEKCLNSTKKGGSVIIIEEWEPPKSKPEATIARRRGFRDTVIEKYKNRIVFEAALRETIVDGFDSGMYGYLWRKIN